MRMCRVSSSERLKRRSQSSIGHLCGRSWSGVFEARPDGRPEPRLVDAPPPPVGESRPLLVGEWPPPPTPSAAAAATASGDEFELSPNAAASASKPPKSSSTRRAPIIIEFSLLVNPETHRCRRKLAPVSRAFENIRRAARFLAGNCRSSTAPPAYRWRRLPSARLPQRPSESATTTMVEAASWRPAAASAKRSANQTAARHCRHLSRRSTRRRHQSGSPV